MDPTTMSPFQWLMVAAGLGFLVGLVPLMIGFIKGNIKYGVIGLAACIAGGSILGVFLSIPAAAIFSWLILRGSKTAAPSAEPDNSLKS